jgi:hypothetical protein
MLVVLLISNIIIAADTHAPAFYQWSLFAQVFFYVVATAGWWLVRSGNAVGIFAVPFYFLFMNYCLVKGFIRFWKGDQHVLWERSAREAAK